MEIERTNVDVIARFRKIVLSWDYLSLHKESSQKKSRDGIAKGLRKVKNNYQDVDDYIGTFEPLLFEEVKAQIVQGRDDEGTTPVLGAILENNEADGFHCPLVAYDEEEGNSITENELLLLSKEKFEGKVPTAYAFGIVLNREDRNCLKLQMFLAGEVEGINADKVKPVARLSNMHEILNKKEREHRGVWILKIASLSTIIREYIALWSIRSLPFKDLILSGVDAHANSEHRPWKIPKPLMNYLKENHNESQLDAINAGLSRRTFVLIQGPPGTGKTQTILGLLSAILHASPASVQSMEGTHDVRRGPELLIGDRYNHWKQASPWLNGINPRDEIMPVDGDDGFFPTTGNDMKPEVVQSNRKYRVRVLVCAPSNSALDEIVLRLLNTGIRDGNDQTYNPKIVRIGLKPHHSVQSVSIDYLVKQKLAGMNSSDVKNQGSTGNDRDSVRASILNEAVIVFSTLSFSGSSIFSKMNHVFDVVIIDEAAQAVEAATLIPLSNGCKQVYLVGDPVQLPATVISPIAEKFGYGTSLFERFKEAGYHVEMLNTQYRMHPEIRSFPSREFYEERLKDGDGVEDQTQRKWHKYRCFGPFCFFDIEEGVESQPSGSGSWVNVDEVEFVLAMYHKLITCYPDLKSSSRMAIITPYRHQVKLFRQRFRETFGVESDILVDINTVDGFQGREKDVAIFSCVRANKNKGIGFVADSRRMNVGITRARSSVLVVGSASTLKVDKHWNNLVESAQERNCLFKVPKPYASFFSDENLKTMEIADEEEPTEKEETQITAAMFNNAVDDGDVGNADDDGGDDGGGYDED